MSANRLAFLMLSLLTLSSFAQGQESVRTRDAINELSVTVGRTFISTQTLQNPAVQPAALHFGNEETVEFNYSRLLLTHGIFGLYGEVPVAIAPRVDLSTPSHGIPKDIGSLFATPSARVNFFYGQGLTPWASVGAGYARWRESSSLNFFGSNPGPTGTNTYAVQFGAGLDAWVWRRWGIRMEARDYLSGLPNLNIYKVTNGHQNNYYVGIGVIRRF